MENTEPVWRTPAVLAVLGLGLMIGGWKASSYLPPLARGEAEEERQLDRVRSLAAREEGTGPERLAERLRAYSHRARYAPPFRAVGRVAFLGGLFLFITAAVLFYRQPAAPAEAVEEEDEASVGFPGSP